MYEKHIFFCENKRDPFAPRPSCGLKNATQLRNSMKDLVKTACPSRKIRVNMAGCLDRCEEGPSVVVYPDAKWFKIENEDQVKQFVQEYLVEGKPAQSLAMEEK